jgi:SAM-dependent methyltransferase
VLAQDLVSFVLANLPSAPARVLEVGAGQGELARLLTSAGYDVVAIDPSAENADVLPIPLAEIEAPAASFDAAVAVVSLHHVDPLGTSCARLAEVLRPRAALVVDEFDVDRFDERAAGWWIEQRRALGFAEARSARELIADMRAEVHPLSRIQVALKDHFDLEGPRRGSYLYRWGLDEALRASEEELIAAGALPPVGARLIGRCVDRPARTRAGTSKDAASAPDHRERGPGGP